MAFHHVSVLREETIDNLIGNPSGIYVDCTLGGGGHDMAAGITLDLPDSGAVEFLLREEVGKLLDSIHQQAYNSPLNSLFTDIK